MLLIELANQLGGRLYGEDKEVQSLTLPPHPHFFKYLIILHDERWQDQKLIQEAEQGNASAFLSEHPLNTKLPYILVKSIPNSLYKLAQFRRQKFTLPLIAITGSCGKTTTKNLLGKILQRKFSTLVTRGNDNCVQGVPITLINIHQEHQVGVIEVGLSEKGDIDHLGALVKPKIAVITGAATAHFEAMGSLKAIAMEKAALLKHVLDKGIAVLNRDDRFFDYWVHEAGNHAVVSFGIRHQADVSAVNIQLQKGYPSFELKIADQSIGIDLKLLGQHQVYNALAASAAAYLFGLSLSEIKQGLEDTLPAPRRLAPYKINDSILIDDTFSATPLSVLAAIKVLNAFKGKRVLVLANMTPVTGKSYQVKCHTAIGRAARMANITALFGLGELAKYSVAAFGSNGKQFTNKVDLINELHSKIQQNTTILIKGAHYMQMDDIVHALLKGKGY